MSQPENKMGVMPEVDHGTNPLDDHGVHRSPSGLDQAFGGH